MGNSDGQGFNMPGADKLGDAFAQAQNANTTVAVMECKCGSITMIPQKIVEARVKRTPGILTEHPTQGMKEEVQHRDISYVYVCAMCGEIVYVHQIAKPSKVPKAPVKDGDGKAASQEHVESIEEDKGPG